MIGRAKISARRGLPFCVSVNFAPDLSRAVRLALTIIVSNPAFWGHAASVAKPCLRRGSNPARENRPAKRHPRRAEVFALPAVGHLTLS
jgi:hypothetical protein